MHKVGLYWFGQDLRLHDNAALMAAARSSRQLICLYCVEPQWFRPNRYGITSMGPQRWRFLWQTLQDLDYRLQQLGQRLMVVYQQPLNGLPEIISRFNVDALFSSVAPGYYEQERWRLLKRRYPFLHFEQQHTHTLWQEADLPFPLSQLPDSFSKFRRQVEQLPISPSAPAPQILPPPPVGLPYSQGWLELPSVTQNSESYFAGGESQALAHTQLYFASQHPSHYKEVRNALDGWTNSTKFSPWLANGALSPREIIADLTSYEEREGANDSTYWIYFELLWREYFQWYAHAHGPRLYHPQGIQAHSNKNHTAGTSFYPARFQKWCHGNTPYPLVNACMKQLNATGYMSNRGRQIVASCLVNELALDWRYGAAYFEEQLIDYDVAANWGNWQYLGGVGADPRGKRRFDIAKQTSQYDPQRKFIQRWEGDEFDEHLDDIDAADWPISHPKK